MKLAPLVILVASTAAEAKRPMRIPPAARCDRKGSWGELTKCLTDEGSKPHLERTIGSAKLYLIESGYALYVHEHGTVRLGGLYGRTRDDTRQHVEILDAAELVLGGHTGYRIELGEERTISISLDDLTSRDAVQIMKHTLYCSGTTWSCANVITRCDILVDGRARWTFRGTPTITGGRVRVAGDRSIAGSCASEVDQFLGWGS